MNNESLKMIFTPEEIREIRWQAAKMVIEKLTKGASGPDAIGRRVIYMDFIMSKGDGFTKLKDLAERLDVSPAAACRGVAAMEAALFDVKSVNFSKGEIG